MTELQALLTFLVNLPFFKGQSQDIFRFARRLRTILDHNDDSALVVEANKILVFDDHLVRGLNTGKFTAVSGYSTYPHSVLPKFLFGLTSRVFELDGTLLEDYDGFSFDMLVTGLRLVRRCSIKSQSSIAEAAGVAEFLDAQRAPSRPFDFVVADSMSTMWSCLLDNPTKDLELGFPGPGAVLKQKFPYVSRMQFVDPSTVPLPIRGYMVRAVDRFLPDYFEVTSPSNLIQVHKYIPYPDRVSKLVTVPKSFRVKRGISITDVVSVIIGATLRKTCWNAARRHGLRNIANVHDQSRSHRILYDFFDQVALLDLKGGSTCFTVEQQLHYLSRTKFGRDMFNYSRPFSIIYKNDPEVAVTTLTMGDASCTSLLTMNLVFFALLAVARTYLGLSPREPFPPAMWQTVIDFIIETGIFDMLAVVGDDVIIPQEIYEAFVDICESQNVTINTSKSSVASSPHKESCGFYCIRTSKGKEAIYPSRARTPSKDLVTNLSAISSNRRRSRKSRLALELLIANASFSHQLEYLNNNAYNESDIGSPVGINPQPRRVIPRPQKQRNVPDDIGCAFGCKDSKIAALETKRPVLVRGKVVSYRSSIPTQSNPGLYDPNAHLIEIASGPYPQRFKITGGISQPIELPESEFIRLGK